ncbi:hypothetical protein FHS18_001330 [Paenibacillus phyllosphaerae]|uniref:Uncharacterized protein n=1 Tax=Paenibacillus phyllosphaerae TaxID=274593 RepID=A0A7W5AUZ8_9BACL|nr:hypothetical protein [Paenibacillus phyllosphaerae]MBB3109278.1 hypothetical protein [Paenibacillus phyllosphaerae]
MKIWKRLIASAAAAIMVTVILSVLPMAERHKLASEGAVAVFRAVPVKRLSNENLVDSIIGQQLKLPIRKAEWKQGVLSLDLAIDTRPDRIDIWMSDLERLLDLSFLQTVNVNRLLVRFVAYPAVPGPYKLQAAVDVRRTDSWLSKELAAVDGARPDEDSQWRQKLRMTFVSEMGSSQ